MQIVVFINSRGYHWANYATTLGAAMHELGHTFNLPHTPSGIMGRGFDDMNVFFVGSKGQLCTYLTPKYFHP